MKKCGLLQPISALPSQTSLGDWGVGDFGPNAFEFVEMIADAQIKVWQILPINPLGYGNSPYQPYSSFALDELYISIDKLVTIGLLDQAVIASLDPTLPNVDAVAKNMQEKSQHDYGRVDYNQARADKLKYLQQAFKNFQRNYSMYEKEFELFKLTHSWVVDYSIFITFKKINGMKCWTEWPADFKDYPKQKNIDLTLYQESLTYEMFVQFILIKQWQSLRHYANKRQIEIMGDIPIYVSIDSQDVWANQQYFLLDEQGNPEFVAGVPPDYFAATGQRWGNPIYDWKKLEADGFQFWVDRIKANSDLFDIVRIDHFRAFDTYWSIPSSCETAIDGQWLEAPGYQLFDKLYNKIEHLNIVVEDLGELRDEVGELRDHYHLKGMKIVQFTFDPNEKNNTFNDREHMIIYTGTHDNSTVLGWFKSQNKKTQANTLAFLKVKNRSEFSTAIIKYTLDSIADLAVIPTWDILELDDRARFNTPGTVGGLNWQWQLNSFDALKVKLLRFKELVVLSHRQ